LTKLMPGNLKYGCQPHPKGAEVLLDADGRKLALVVIISPPFACNVKVRVTVSGKGYPGSVSSKLQVVRH